MSKHAAYRVLFPVLIWATALASACGASSRQRITDARQEGPVEQPKLPPVKPAALNAFEAGMRWLRAAEKRDAPRARTRALNKAEAELGRSVEIDGSLWEAWHNLGALHYDRGDDDRAVEAFDRALAVNPAHLPSQLGRAEAHRRAGRTDQARADYEQAVARSAADGPVKRNATARLASLLREARAYDDALAVIRDTLRTAGASAKVYVELGMLYMAQDRGELADLVLGKAVEIDPEEPSIYNASALLALSRGRSQEAFEQFDRATALDPSYLDARFNKASVLMDAGDYGRAKEELASVVTQNPDDLSARVALGVAHRGMGEYDRAKTLWENVAQDAPLRSRVRGDALFDLAILQMYFLGNEKAAVTALERFLQDAPRNHPKRKDAENKKKELGL